MNNKVTSSLNVRKSAKTSSKSVLQIPKNTAVTIKGISWKSGKYWYKVKTTYKNKTKTGYVLSDYITVNAANSASSGNTGTSTPANNTTSKAGYVNDKVATYLNIRKSASTTSSVLLKIPRNTVVSVLGTSGRLV